MSTRNTCHSVLHRTAGFTLVELMVVVAVLGVLAVVAAPGMQGLIRGYRLSSAAGELNSTLQLARSEAIRRNAAVTVCPSSNGSTCGSGTSWTRWIVFSAARTGMPADDAEVIRDEALPASVQVSGPTGGIRFSPSGMVAAQQTVTVCVPYTNPSDNQRVLTVMTSGTTRSAHASGGGACP